VKDTIRLNGHLQVARQLDRRRFLQLIFLSGVAVGCQRIASPTPTGSPGTLTLDLRFALENAAVDYGPHPRGCDVTSIKGSVHTADGASASDVVVKVWGDDVAQAVTLQTDAGGYYSCDVASSLTNQAFHVQLTDPAATTLLSDVVVAQAVASCDLNLMTINFVAAQ
jgi:hypothetical protein